MDYCNTNSYLVFFRAMVLEIEPYIISAACVPGLDCSWKNIEDGGAAK